jgi:hypothetical protein
MRSFPFHVCLITEIYSVSRAHSIDIHCCMACYMFCSRKLQQVISMLRTYNSEIFLKLDVRKSKASCTPSGLLYTAENTLAASCFRIPEFSTIDFSRYLIQK